MPRFAICNETYGPRDFADVCADVAGRGYTGIELAPFVFHEDPRQLDARWAAQTRATAERAGIEIVGLHWLLLKPEGLHWTTPDPSVRRRTAAFVSHLAQLCGQLGGTVLVWGSPVQRSFESPQTEREAFANAREVLCAIADDAAAAGVTIALEPLAPRLTNFLNTAEQACELIEAVDHSAIRLHLDVAAMSTESTAIPELIRTYASRLAHFHANDPNQRGPGFGDVDFRPILSALDEVNYTGWVSVEVFDYSPDPETIAEQSLRYLERCSGE